MQHMSSTGHSVMTRKVRKDKVIPIKQRFSTTSQGRCWTQKKNVPVRTHKDYFYSCRLQALHIHLFTCLFNGAVSTSQLQFRMTGRLWMMNWKWRGMTQSLT